MADIGSAKARHHGCSQARQTKDGWALPWLSSGAGEPDSRISPNGVVDRAAPRDGPESGITPVNTPTGPQCESPVALL